MMWGGIFLKGIAKLGKGVLIFVLAFFLVGCESEEEKVIKTWGYDSYSNNFQPNNSLYLAYFTTESDYFTYYFDQSIYSEADCNRIVNQIEDMVSFLGEHGLSISQGSYICFGDSIKNVVQDENIFISSDSDVITQTALILSGICGEGTNYGLAYGVANYIRRELYSDEFKVEESQVQIDDEMLKSSLSTIDPEHLQALLRLDLPAFEVIYFSESENQCVKYIVSNLVDSLIDHEEYGLEYVLNLLSESYKLDSDIDNRISAHLNQWFEDGKFQVVKTAESTPIRFTNVLSNQYPYKIYTLSSESYFDLEFTQFDKDNLPKREKVRFEDIIQILVNFEADVTEINNYFSTYFPDPLPVIKIYFNPNDSGKASYYKKYSFPASIELIEISSLFHEYIHYVTLHNLEYEPDPVIMEGIAYYYDNYKNDTFFNYNNMSKTFYSNSLSTFFQSEAQKEGEESKLIMNCYYKLFGDEIIEEYNVIFQKNYSEICAFLTLEGYDNWGIVLMQSYHYGKVETYQQAASLINYMVEEYGEEKLMKVLEDYDSFKDIYGKSLRDLITEWEEYMYNKFQ